MRVFGGSGYPPALATLHAPPPFLFAMGTVPEMPTIAVVGSRQSTDYGLNAARQMSGELAARGVLIVSGFARGIDTAAHTAALDAGGITVAVWGCGPDTIYPRENKALAGRIAERGGILTEFPFGTPPEPQNFPVRNRLIAGLSAGVLVVQARQRSGALLTVQHALEQGKDVYAIPGEIGHPQSAGVNDLIKQGAKVVTCSEDILFDLGLREAAGLPSRPSLERPLPTLTALEHRVYAGLGGSACHIDRLAVSLRLSAAECAAVLISLELKGIVRHSAGNMFSRLA
jgi:DNA processing protein